MMTRFFVKVHCAQGYFSQAVAFFPHQFRFIPLISRLHWIHKDVVAIDSVLSRWVVHHVCTCTKEILQNTAFPTQPNVPRFHAE